MTAATRHPRFTADQILAAARSEICALAAAVGIDGEQLLAQRLPVGQLICGQQLPVLSRRDRGRCSALLYVNETESGNSWPFLRFFTFRHGGVVESFNGLRWWRERGRAVLPVARRSAVRLNTAGPQDETWRETRHARLCYSFARGIRLTPAHAWLKRRLCGLADPALLARIAMVHAADNSARLLLPLEHPERGRVGFHQILVTAGGDKKRHYIRRSGLLRGSFVRIRPLPGAPSMPVALCEGVATALSIALVWPGEIRIALSANNLAAVRESVAAPVVFFHDNDLDKPQVGNVGLNAARKAAQPEDRLCGSAFGDGRPEGASDFNDLLRLKGLAELARQVRRAGP